MVAYIHIHGSTVKWLIEARVDGAHAEFKALSFCSGQNCRLLLHVFADDTGNISNSLMTVFSAKMPFKEVLNTCSGECQGKIFGFCFIVVTFAVKITARNDVKGG